MLELNLGLDYLTVFRRNNKSMKDLLINYIAIMCFYTLLWLCGSSFYDYRLNVGTIIIICSGYLLISTCSIIIAIYNSLEE